ncbi:hypothetical protein Q1695_000508 [Nippostrongylus brasiliensis]|nr:hypothetical protein Q1695_000508 [Nippostrongylus brasiliensis]
MSHEELEAKEKEKNVIGLLSLLTNAVMHNSYILVSCKNYKKLFERDKEVYTGVDRSPLLEKNATGGTANVTSPLKISTSSCDQEVLYKRTEACIKCSNEAIDKRTFVIVDKQPTEANNDCTNHTSEDCIHQENMLHQSQEAGDQDSSFKCQFPDLPVIRKSIGESSVMEKFGELLRVPTFKMCVAL